MIKILKEQIIGVDFSEEAKCSPYQGHPTVCFVSPGGEISWWPAHKLRVFWTQEQMDNYKEPESND